MAYWLSLTEIDKARQIAKRAIKSINFREEGEKRNVWVALLNLENTYGTQQSLMQIFNDCLNYNEPLDMYVILVEIFEKSDNLKMAEETYKTMANKFKDSSQIWIKYGTFLMKNNDQEKARQLLDRALKCLPKQKHLPTISKFAQLEFKFGSPEKGRTIFETLLGNYPKRVDMWLIYLDLEIKAGQQDIIKHLFERVISLNLSAKKMNSLFKKKIFTL